MPNLSTQGFIRLLRSEKVPHYAYPRVEPQDIFETYRFGILSGTRKIATGNSSYFSRQSESYKINKETQIKIWKRIVRAADKKWPYVLAVSSPVTDYMAHEVAATLLLDMIRNANYDLKWKWYTTQWKPYEYANNAITGNLIKPDVVVIRSILPTAERNYEIRDILDYYNTAIRIVVLGGINGMEFFDNYLHYPLSGILHVEGYKGSIPKELWVKDEKGNTLTNDDFRNPLFVLNKNQLDDLPIYDIGKKFKKRRGRPPKDDEPLE